jgi:hypothetical protein
MNLGSIERAVLLLAGLTLATPTFAGELYIYEHNGSIIDWYVLRDSIKATYQLPRPGLQAVGVAEGTTLFEGAYEGIALWGQPTPLRLDAPPPLTR